MSLQEDYQVIVYDGQSFFRGDVVLSHQVRSQLKSFSSQADLQCYK